MKVFLTGASSGLGLALATRYALAGATLGLVARRGDLLDAFAADHPACTVARYALDVCDHGALAEAADDFVARFGLPDVVIANAGISAGSVTGEADLIVFERVMAINYLAMVATFEPFLPRLRQAGRACTLVGIASVAGVRGLPGAGAYSASKAAAMRYLESLRVELHDGPISVVTIAPGYIRTPMTARNPYRMPFLIDADVFARRAVRAIAQRRRFTVIPWPMRIVAASLHILPRWLYDRLFAHAPRKPRDTAGPTASERAGDR